MAIEVNDQAPKIVRKKSTRFVCKSCGNFCWEWIPMVKLGMKKQYFNKMGMPKVRVVCPHGHNRGFVDLGNLKRL